MALKNNTVAWVGTLFGLLLVSFGLMSFGVDSSSYLLSVLSLFIGLALVMEVGVKVLWSLHKIKKLTALQYITLIVGSLDIVAGIINLPFVELQNEMIALVTGGLLLLSAVLWFIELFTQTND